MNASSPSRKVVLVTGSGRGIGAAIARRLAQHGWSVGVNYVRDRDAAEGVVADIRAHGGSAIALQADAASAAEVEQLFDACTRQFGPIGALVNNAGITGGFGRLIDMDSDAIARVIEVNLTGPLLCSLAAIRRMSTSRGGNGGAIVNVSSMAAASGGARVSLPYGASKGGLNTLTAGLAREYGAEGIRANAVMPGLIPTDIHGDMPIDQLRKRVSAIPLGRLGSVEDCAETVAWLLSDAAAYVSGAIVPVAGGM